MRAGRDYSDSFQTKTSASSEKISRDRLVDQVSQRFQTSAIRLGGRKGENGRVEGIANELEEAKQGWSSNGDEIALRSALLKVVLRLERE